MSIRAADARLSRRTAALVGALGAASLALVLAATLLPIPWAIDGAQQERGILDPAAWTDRSAWTEGRPLEVLANVIMFLPLGLVSGLLLRGPLRALAPIALTAGIELAQIPLDDRISHPRDLIANAAGAALGLLIAAAVQRRRRAISMSTALRRRASEGHRRTRPGASGSTRVEAVYSEAVPPVVTVAGSASAAAAARRS